MLFGHFWDYGATMARALPKNVPAAIALAHYPKFKGVDHCAHGGAHAVIAASYPLARVWGGRWRTKLPL